GSDVASEVTGPPYAAWHRRLVDDQGDLFGRRSRSENYPRLSEVTSGKVCGLSVGALDERWLVDAADLLCLPATGVEPACGRGIGRARYVTSQHDLLPHLA